jgi:cyclohexanecarboxyl-CoA dehydrogenase
MGVRGIGSASITLDNVRIPANYRIGDEGTGFYTVMAAFDWIRVFLGLEVLALGEQSVYDAIDYAKQRTAFGKPIAKYDAVSFRLVDSLAKIEAAKLLCYKALWLKDQGTKATRETAMAKSICPAIGIEACNNAMRTLGHVGYSSDYPVEQRLRDAYGFQFMDGTADIQRIVMVREFIGKDYLNYT